MMKIVLLGGLLTSAPMSVLGASVPLLKTYTLKKSTIQYTPETLDLVQQRLAEGATHSWEIGTRETALLELSAPGVFLYRPNTIPPRISSKDNVTDMFLSVDSVLANKPPGIQTFFADGAAGDPNSVGIPFLIRNATLQGANPTTNYSIAVAEQLQHILAVNRTADGAISHRDAPEPVQLWADFMSMAPPFIAYYGAITHNKTLLDLAYLQVVAQRSNLITLQGTGANLVEHIVYGNVAALDPGHWSTGNAWFVNGMIRVLRVIQLSSFAGQMKDEQAQIIQWANDILNAAWGYQLETGALNNYIDGAEPGSGVNSTSVFPESSGTALLAASTFRLAALTFYSPSTDYSPSSSSSKNHLKVNIPAAERARQYIVSNTNTTTGWLEYVVDPLDWSRPGQDSPEGQAFVVMLQAAYRDWWAITGGRYYG